MKAKSLKKLLVIKEICSWLKTFSPSNRGGSQEHIFLIILHVCNLVENLFSTLILGSVFNDYVVFCRDTDSFTTLTVLHFSVHSQGAIACFRCHSNQPSQ